ncbi:2-oxo-4-hydroxy-4-carboxy-5-ureidoimidazoline decarboxylase [Mycobacterium dioxanotrophicus]|jgi:2-oxo-4-hydroxy-4-carboxy-5-ureidoimidazoline decarboxylase|nr:2-oxo-4-hydroxy-4-carboxy-5-ureidoimidazoline decarboxylase [Mycobacterium dioxanotrophicus]
MTMSLTDFNAASSADAAAAVRPCLDVDRWVNAIVDKRPYPDLDAVVAVARSAADPFTEDELITALSHHPRIGERASGATAEAGFSRAEQSGVSADADVQRRLLEGNRAYEKRFGHVFLIRAAGRSSEEILAALEERLTNDAATEKSIMADQLRQIAVLRLQGVLA